MGNFHERGKHAPLSLVMRASSRMLLLSRQSLSHQTFSHQGEGKKKKIFSASDTKDRLLILTASASTMFPNLRSHTVLTGLRTPVLVCRQPHGLVAQKPRLQITSSPHVCLAPAFCCMPQPRLTASLLCLHGVSCQKATASASKKTRSLNDSYPSKQHLRLQAERAFDSMMPDLHLQNLG